ncbi:proline-rich receptor-like protein kinase PERK1 [Humulus lupulus]|uniref:proline-rich receptor-like protein kinase PERK1 n=1 Tax=Humulus lupulus TaxID=3486 RepID=UPI002B40A788|nr:proline-rich receptor-like protein kinase PERK1 [Humulus lupulus]
MSSLPPAISPPTNTTFPFPPPPPPAPEVTLPTQTPPPPPPSLTPTPETGLFNSSPPPPPSPENGNLSTGTIVGMIVGIGIGGMSMLVAVCVFYILYRRYKRKKRRRHGLESNGGGGAPPHPKNGPPGAPAQQPQQSNAHVNNKLVVFPTPTPPAGVILNYPAASASTNSGSEKPLHALTPGMGLELSQGTFTYEELAKATDGFSPANLLGEGGFGYVHKGVLPSGKVVAIKQLKAGSGQGEREFKAEVEFIGRVHHRHLVSLVGYCSTGIQRMLVYEFVPNSTLEFHLHGNGRPTMNWPTRMKIAIGSARGMAYLHEDCQPKIIHRDIKAANILLDNDFEAKVADFGLAKSSLDTDTHVSTRVMGTFGYLAPEYASSGKLTDKSDVFSFGVVLLELITGHHPIDKFHSFTNDSMVEWARPLLMQALENGNFDGLVDPKLKNDYNPSEMTRMVACASACVRHSARLRPRMSQILQALEGHISLDDLNEGIKPGHSTIYSSYGSQDYMSHQYKEDMEKFKKLALQSQEQGTSEYSLPSTESGLNPSASSTEDQQTTEENQRK